MLEPPEILHTEEQLTAVIHLTIPRSEIRNVMAPGLGCIDIFTFARRLVLVDLRYVQFAIRVDGCAVASS
jgi:hypothetical protein